MTEKFRKIDRQYVLSDSSVNVYGFRLLTSGYDLDAFRRNPIGYYMHRRDEGTVVKWEDLAVVDDKVVGYPVINMSHPRGEQICNEAENGFLNAASVGHIVVLEHSTDPELMLPGQTGPTITRWFNKECSLVDIPGNDNALTTLYDAQENEINLVDLGQGLNVLPALPANGLTDLRAALQLADTAALPDVLAAITSITNAHAGLISQTQALVAEKQELQQQLQVAITQRDQHEITTLLDRALEDKKITVGLRNQLMQDYAANVQGLKDLLNNMPAYHSLTHRLRNTADTGEATWQWDDYQRKDPSGKKLTALRENDFPRFEEIYRNRFVTS